MAKAQGVSLQLRIRCLNPPQGICADQPAKFGLQDKAQNLQPGQPLPDEALQFECPVEIIEEPVLDFKGSYVHGTPATRFLYLSLGCQQNDQWHWIRRIKIPLTGITSQHINAAIASKGVLQVTVDGQRAGSAKLTEKDWIIG